MKKVLGLIFVLVTINISASNIWLEGGADVGIGSKYGFNLSMGQMNASDLLTSLVFDSMFFDSSNADIRLALEMRYYSSLGVFYGGEIGVGNWIERNQNNIMLVVSPKIGYDFGSVTSFFHGVSVAFISNGYISGKFRNSNALQINFGGPWGEMLYGTLATIMSGLGRYYSGAGS